MQVCATQSRSPFHSSQPLVEDARGARRLNAVDVAAMAERYDYNQEYALVDGVNDAVVADTNPEAGATLKGLCARRVRILTEEGNRPLNASLIRGVDAAQSLERGGPNLNSVLAHSGPAEIGLDLRPGNVLTLFSHGCVERSCILSVLQCIHHALVLGWADDDSFYRSTSLEEDGFPAGTLDELGENAPCGSDGNG